MKILFTTFYDPNYLGIRYLGAVLKEAGHDVKILQLKDFHHRLINPGDTGKHTGYFLYSKGVFSSSGDSEFPITEKELSLFEQSITDFDPDIIGVTNRSPYNHLLALMLPAIRKASSRAFIVGGGFGPTFEPEISLKLGADAVIRGEGEGAILDLASSLDNGTDWTTIKNISHFSNGKLINNPLRALITDLDSVPFPLYYGNHFISIDNDELAYTDMRFRSHGGVHSSTYTILTGRGCIGNCSYCAGGNWREQYKLEKLRAPLLRTRSMENVMNELLMAKNHGEKFITFSDEYLVRNSNTLQKFFKEYQQKVDLPFFAHFHHVQLIEKKNGQRELLETVKKAGLQLVAIGVQSASENFAQKVYFRKNKNEEIIEAIRIFQEHGLSGNYQIIGGNPLESDSDIEALYNFCAQIPFDPSLKTKWSIHTAILKLLKGSPLATQHPELANLRYIPSIFSEIALLADLHNKVDEKTFTEIRNNPFYKGHPERLHFLLKQIIRDKHHQYLLPEIERLKGKEVWFWGAGEMFQYKSYMFSETRARGILLDSGNLKNIPKSINGLNVFHPDDVLPNSEPIPIVTFTGNPNAICRTIEKKYPQYKDIVACAVL